MRWEYQEPKIWDKKTIRKFLLLPRTLDNETRWLEFASIICQYKNYYPWGNKWVAIHWA